MASLVSFASGTTSATASLVLPPGDADDAIGYKRIVLDSITASILASATPVTVGAIALRRGGSTQNLLVDGAQVAANAQRDWHFTFPGGLVMPGANGGTKDVFVSAPNGSVTKCTVTYHYEN